MILDLKKVFATENYTLPISSQLDMHEVDYMGRYPLKTPIRITGCIFNKGGLITLQLSMVVVFSAPCDRCGLPTDTEYTVTLEKSLAPEIEGEDSDSILPVPNYRLDLSELVRDEVLLSLPMKHLCRPDCKGICVKCGKNLNSGDCGCSAKEIDPRLSALADLLKENNRDSGQDNE